MGRFCPVNWFNHTSWVAVVTPTDRPKSASNRCVIKDFWLRFCVVALLLRFFSVSVGFFLIGLSQAYSFFSFICFNNPIFQHDWFTS